MNTPRTCDDGSGFTIVWGDTVDVASNRPGAIPRGVLRAVLDRLYFEGAETLERQSAVAHLELVLELLKPKRVRKPKQRPAPIIDPDHNPDLHTAERAAAEKDFFGG
jgi:hypothetical protein